MGIKQYEKSGKILYKVSVCQRDERGRKFQRSKSNIISLREAKKIEKRLLLEASKAISEAQRIGPSWGSLVERWEVAARSDQIIGKKISITTIRDHVGGLREYTDIWWDMPATKIERADIYQMFETMECEGKSFSRRKNVKSAINSVFEWAIDFGHLSGVSSSPAKEISLGKRVESEPKILNNQEIKKLLRLAKETKHPWYPVWAVALLTGMRNGELYALLWSDVDFERKVISVSRSFNSKTKSNKCTKNGKYRFVPINDGLMGILRELKLSSKGRKEVLPRLPRWANGEAAKILRVFMKGYGLPPVKFHDLRACFATQLMRNNVPIPQVQKICGWEDLKTTQRYIRLAGIEIDGATDSLEILPDEQVMGRVQELFINQ